MACNSFLDIQHKAKLYGSSLPGRITRGIIERRSCFNFPKPELVDLLIMVAAQGAEPRVAGGGADYDACKHNITVYVGNAQSTWPSHRTLQTLSEI